MRKLSGFLIAVLLLVCGSVSVSATERILKFESNITVNTDGSLLVKETIRVQAEGRAIRRGIYRDFPIRYRNQNGTWRKVGFKLISVQRDGQGEPHHSVYTGDYRRIYIGDKDTFLRPGEYTYEIIYKTTRQIRFFDEFDELYWNVTGNKWQFPIDNAVAIVILPKGATILQSKAYTGRFGQVGREFEATKIAPGIIRFETTRKLGRLEGLTIAVGWQKGIIAEPSKWSRWLWSLWENLGLIILALGTLGIGGFYYTTWDRIGRDPEGGVIIPLFSAPKGLSPAAVSYIHYRKFKSKGSGASLPFIAALVSLAIKKQLVIEKPDSTLTLKRLDGPAIPLPKGEKAIYNKLLNTRKTIEFKQSTAPIVQAARSNFKYAIEAENGDRYFKNNIGFFIAGVVMSGIVLFGFFFLQVGTDKDVMVTVVSVISAAAGSLLLSMGMRRLWEKLPGGGSKVFGVFLTIAGVAVLVPLFAVILGIEHMPRWVPVALGALAAMNVVFYNLLHAPTELGRKVMDDIEGFKLYLSVAETDRMNMRGAPKVTPEIFEKFLPFAIGMGVEKPWSDALESQLAKAGMVDNAYHPTWYRGSSGWSSRDLGAATAGIVGGVAAGMAEATPPSTSGSSGGGGGFSGGGGGGGGGGGW